MQWKSNIAFIAVIFVAPLTPAQSINWSDRDAVVSRAVDVSPALAGAATQVRAARERIGPAGALPNPMLMAGVRDQQIDLTTDEMMTMYMVGASQTLTRRSRRNALTKSAELEVQRLEQESNSL